MTTSESKGRFFYKTNRFESIRITNRIESIRIVNWNALQDTKLHQIFNTRRLWKWLAAPSGALTGVMHFQFLVCRDVTTRYDRMRDAILTCVQKLTSQLNLPHATKN